MNAIFKSALAAAAVALATQAVAQVTFYEHDGFAGRSFTTGHKIDNLKNFGFNDRASSVVVVSDRWEVCDNAGYSGRCVVLRRGSYPSLAAMGLNDRVSSVRAVSRNARVNDDRYAPTPPAPSVTFYEAPNFGGRSLTTGQELTNFKRTGFNDRASSVIVVGQRFEACENANFGGRCVVLTPGRYPTLGSMGMNDRVSSVRAVGPNMHFNDDRYAPAPAPITGYEYRRRDHERTYEAQVTSVRAVVGTPEQRCWVEPEQVVQQQSSNINVPGAIAGAVIGGILGHQVGNGQGKDLATAGGVVVGAAVGANVGRTSSGQQTTTQNVQRCASTPSQARPDYWDVTYNFRGQDHRVQMTAPPGHTVTVNEQGEPRA